MGCKTFLNEYSEIPQANRKGERSDFLHLLVYFVALLSLVAPSSKQHDADMVSTQEANQASLLQALHLFYTEDTPTDFTPGLKDKKHIKILKETVLRQ